MKSSAILLLFWLIANALAFAQTSKSLTAPERFIDVDGGRLYYKECGTGTDAVVLLHDGVVNSAVWDDVWPAFCKRFHTVR